MKNQQNEFVDKTIQDDLRRLISEEYYAHMLYIASKMAVIGQERCSLADLFDKISGDELNDHMRQLVLWCREFGCDVPTGETEFRKYAGKDIVRQYQQLKKSKDPTYYVDQAIAAEQLAITSYKAALGNRKLCQYTDLQALVWHIYYDEVEHLEKFKSARIAIDANVDMIF